MHANRTANAGRKTTERARPTCVSQLSTTPKGRRSSHQVESIKGAQVAAFDDLYDQAEEGEQATSNNWEADLLAKRNSSASWSSLSSNLLLLRILILLWRITKATLQLLNLLLLNLAVRVGNGSLWLAGSGRGLSDVDAGWVAGTAWVLLAALGLADVVALIAAGDAVLGPLLAHVVWEGERVLGHVWGLAIAADTVVGELLLLCG